MIGYFKERSALQVPAFVLLALVLKIGFAQAQSSGTTLPDTGLLSRWLTSGNGQLLHPSFTHILNLLVLAASALYANTVLSTRKMFAQRHMLAAMSILLFTALFPGTNQFSPATLLLPLLIVLFAEITRLYTNSQPRSALINIGLIFGLGYLLFHPFIWLLPACFFGLATMRSFRLVEWLLLLLGAATPLYFVLSYEYLTETWAPARHMPAFGNYQPIAVQGWYWYATWGLAGIWLLAALSGWQAQSRRMVIQGRKNWYVLMVMALCCVPGLFWPAGNSAAMLTLISFPVGCLLANAFTGEGKGIGQLLFFWLIVLVIALVSWGWKTGAMN